MTEKRHNNLHIGVQIAPNDPFWVQVNETVRQELAEQFVPFEVISRGWDLTDDQMEELSEEILSNEFDAFICMILPDKIITRLLENGLPVICVEDEIEIAHPLFSSVRGWYDAGKLIAQFLAEALAGAGQVLCLTGNAQETQNLDFSRQRLAGIHAVFAEFPGIEVQVLQSYWDYETAVSHLNPLITSNQLTPPHAILGLSDSLAFAAKHAAEGTPFITNNTLIAGINGEPTALSEILKGTFQATVNISAEEFAGQAVKLARKAALGQPLPTHFYFSTELVTRSNVAEISIQKLDAISNIPSRLVGINRKTEENRLIQYEITASINQKMAVLRDKSELVHAIAELLRVNYQYSRVHLYSLSTDKSQFLLENPTSVPEERLHRPTQEPSILREVYENETATFLADVYFSSNKFAREPRWKQMRSRVVLPVRFGESVLGVLDLQSDQPKMHLRNELIGLQLVADQIGVALHNAKLYEEAIQARAAAEKANQLKTRLLANVSHELRAPLNVILGYCQAILTNPDLYHMELPRDLFRDLGYIFNSGEHLIRLINDLLDVSRAEIGALNLFPETVFPEQLLRDIFGAMADAHDTQQNVIWQLALPTSLPLIKADPVRTRQVIINLLGNAKKFTQAGSITLGADVQTPYLHIWVQDTGPGIPEAQQQNIFEP
ncbi:MAG: substrate-binding domain-containing protein, partial [Chloroflexota bacterium]